MKRNFSANDVDNATSHGLPDEPLARAGLMFLISAALMVVAAITFAGCTDGGSYAVGYGASYYAPDYSPYYSDYVYGGDPYWGLGPYYGGDIIINGGHHRLYYGGHHFAHDRGGGFARMGGGGFRGGGGFHGGRGR
jgi:uncharacterized membrane protein YgcG